MSTTRRTGLLTLLAVLAMGCSPDVQDGTGPIVPIPNVEGLVVRASDGADNLDVELRLPETAEVVASTSTDADGGYWFVDVTAGTWEIKVSGDKSADFSAVSREFSMTADTVPVTVPRMDIARHGADLLQPADHDTLPAPNPFQWLEFTWVLPESTLEWARVQIYDPAGDGVWFSDKEIVDQVSWNGLGNQGDYDGQRVTAGAYRWRVKFSYPDGMEARLNSRELILE